MNIKKGLLKGTVYGMIGSTLLGTMGGIITNTTEAGFLGEDGRNAQQYKGHKEYAGMKAFWGQFIKSIETSARQKGITTVSLMTQLEQILSPISTSRRSTQQQKTTASILIAFIKDYVEASNGGSNSTINKQREESIKRERESQRNTIQNQNIQKNDYNKKVNDGYEGSDFVFDNGNSNNQSTNDNYVKSLGLNKRAEDVVQGMYEGFVESYIGMGKSRQQAITQTQNDFNYFKSFVKKGDVEGTLMGYWRMAKSNGISRSERYFSPFETWINKKGACQGETNLAILFLALAGFGNDSVWYKSYPEINHARIQIKGFSREFDVNGPGLWKRISDGLENYTTSNTESNSYSNSNSYSFENSSNSTSNNSYESESNSNQDSSYDSYSDSDVFDFSS